MPFPLHKQNTSIGQQDIEIFVPDESHVEKAYREGLIEFPYWARIWPSAIALSAFIDAHPEYINNKKVLELGAGLGLPSIVSASLATSVVCSDKEDEALRIVEQSILLHGFHNVVTRKIDWTKDAIITGADTVLLSDVNYDPATLDKLLQVILQLLQIETTILLATPQRLMGRDFLTPLLSYCRERETIPVPYRHKEIPVTIMALKA